MMDSIQRVKDSPFSNITHAQRYYRPRHFSTSAANDHTSLLNTENVNEITAAQSYAWR